MLISVIIPNYNESANLKRGVLRDVYAYLSRQSYSWEIIVSDDGSTDESREMVQTFLKTHPHVRFLQNPHHGKPYALRSGIAAARGQYVLLTDMDQSTPITELEKLIPESQNFQVVIGSRGARRTDSTPLRQLASIIFLLARRAILLPRIKDTQCGFKLIETKLANRIFAHMRIFGRDNHAIGWRVTAYDVEMLYLASKWGYSIQEVRVRWKNEDASTNKSRNFLKESLEMFAEILRVRVNDILGKYDT
jgi:glycosyltransferase involved in cell wall biosynthesis